MKTHLKVFLLLSDNKNQTATNSFMIDCWQVKEASNNKLEPIENTCVSTFALIRSLNIVCIGSLDYIVRFEKKYGVRR